MTQVRSSVASTLGNRYCWFIMHFYPFFFVFRVVFCILVVVLCVLLFLAGAKMVSFRCTPLTDWSDYVLLSSYNSLLQLFIMLTSIAVAAAVVACSRLSSRLYIFQLLFYPLKYFHLVMCFTRACCCRFPPFFFCCSNTRNLFFCSIIRIKITAVRFAFSFKTHGFRLLLSLCVVAFLCVAL